MTSLVVSTAPWWVTQHGRTHTVRSVTISATRRGHGTETYRKRTLSGHECFLILSSPLIQRLHLVSVSRVQSLNCPFLSGRPLQPVVAQRWCASGLRTRKTPSRRRTLPAVTMTRRPVRAVCVSFWLRIAGWWDDDTRTGALGPTRRPAMNGELNDTDATDPAQGVERSS